jgi:hypothetical protein
MTSTAFNIIPGEELPGLGAKQHIDPKVVPLRETWGGEKTPNLERWLSSHQGRASPQRIREIVAECVTSAPTHGLKKFETEAKSGPHAHTTRHPSSAARPSTAPDDSARRRRQTDLIAPIITRHRDFQELRGLDAETMYKRRDEAERYLHFEVMGHSNALLFDARKYTVGGGRRTPASHNKGGGPRHRRKKKKSIAFRVAQGGFTTGLSRTAVMPAKKTMYHVLKNAMKLQPSTHLVRDTLQALGSDPLRTQD